MIFLSPRQWLAYRPRLTQLFVVVLALLGAIAPTWHVCALGGHVGSEHGPHQHGQFEVARNADGSPGPVICACAARDHETKGQTVSQAPSGHEHVNCLALLLQTMPLHGAATPALWRLPATRAFHFRKLRAACAFGAPLSRRGRAPPLEC